jgi:hypothetical protein
MTCSATQQGDEMACGRCALRWDVNDANPPACLQHERRTRPRGQGLPPVPVQPLAGPEPRPEHVTRRQVAEGVDYRALLVKYMRHVGEEEGTTYVARIGTGGRGYFSGVTFSAPELAALLVCDGESAAG